MKNWRCAIFICCTLKQTSSLIGLKMKGIAPFIQLFEVVFYLKILGCFDVLHYIRLSTYNSKMIILKIQLDQINWCDQSLLQKQMTQSTVTNLKCWASEIYFCFSSRSLCVIYVLSSLNSGVLSFYFIFTFIDRLMTFKHNWSFNKW